MIELAIPKSFKVGKYFWIHEVTEKVDGGIIVYDYELIPYMDMFREIMGVPCYVIDWFRSEERNQQMINKGMFASPTSNHLKGAAVDISLTNLRKKWTDDQIIQIAYACEFTGVGMYDKHIHLDRREKPSFWDYRGKGYYKILQGGPTK